MTRICFFHPSFEAYGGAEVLCARQAKILQALGHEVRLVTFAYDPDRWDEELSSVDVRPVKKRTWVGLLGERGRMTKVMVRARRAIREMQDVEVVVAHNPPCNLMLGASRIDARRVWQCNEPPRTLHPEAANPRLTERAKSDLTDALDFATRSWRERLDAHDIRKRTSKSWKQRIRMDIEQTRKLDHIYAISEFSRDNACQIYGRCGEEVVYPVVHFTDGAMKANKIDPDELQVLVHSRLELLKNIDTVIRGFARYQADHPRSTLHIVGEGRMRKQLTDLAAELLPDSAYRMHGYLRADQLHRIYDRCDALALLTLDEPFGMVYPEAAARGLLLIGPDHGGPLEILEDGELGQCIDPFDPEALAEALRRISSLSSTEITRRREAADHACRSRFAAEIIMPRLLDMLSQGC